MRVEWSLFFISFSVSDVGYSHIIKNPLKLVEKSHNPNHKRDKCIVKKKYKRDKIHKINHIIVPCFRGIPYEWYM